MTRICKSLTIAAAALLAGLSAGPAAAAAPAWWEFWKTWSSPDVSDVYAIEFATQKNGTTTQICDLRIRKGRECLVSFEIEKFRKVKVLVQEVKTAQQEYRVNLNTVWQFDLPSTDPTQDDFSHWGADRPGRIYKLVADLDQLLKGIELKAASYSGKQNETVGITFKVPE